MKSKVSMKWVLGKASRLALPVLAAAVLPALFSQPAQARVNEAITGYDGLDYTKLPPTLSATGLYKNIATKNREMTAGIVAFEVNSPLWSDGAHKHRWIQVPAGKTVTPSDSDHYQFPDSTVFIKNFAMDSVYGDTNTTFLHETRFLVIRIIEKDTNFLGVTYKWNRQNTEAFLVPPDQGLDTGIVLRLGTREVAKRWTYPSANACGQCHQGRGVLGFLTPQLNRGGTGTANQLAKLAAAGVLKTNPLTGKPALANFAWAAAGDAGVSDSVKARSYFAANCSQCHGNGHLDLQGATHDFDWLTANKSYRWKSSNDGGYVGKLSSEEKYPRVVYAGYPESSYVLRRMMSRGDLTGLSLWQMPPLATYQVDSVAFKMMKNFICGLGTRGAACQLPAATKDQSDDQFWMFKDSPDTAYGPWVNHSSAIFPHVVNRKMSGFRAVVLGRTLIVEGRPAQLMKVTMNDIYGREIPVSRIRPGEFMITGAIHPGVYFVRNGKESVRINLMP